jgi:hypothetical protein
VTKLEEGVILRSEGKRYKEIAEVLGVSEAWCRKYLRGTKLPKAYLRDIVALALSPVGCSNGEIVAILRAAGISTTLGNIKKECSLIDNKCIFRPSWLDGNAPRASMNMLHTLSDELYYAIESKVEQYMELHPSAHRDSVRKELVWSSCDHISPGGNGARFDRHSDVVCKLEGDLL